MAKEKEKATPAAETAVLAIRAFAEQGTIARVVNVFEMRGMVPIYLSCRKADHYLLFDIEVALDDGKVDEVLLQRLRALVCVDRAEFARVS